MAEQLTKEQWNILDAMRSNLGLAADLAQAKISLILPVDHNRQFFSADVLSGAQKKKPGRRTNEILFLSVFDQAEPLTRLESAEAEELARAEEEPLIAQSLEENAVTEGFREFSPGQFARLKVYPVCDSTGLCFAAVAFEDREADVVFWDTTMDFLRGSTREHAGDPCYRRLTSIDGLALVEAADGRILAANNAARHIYRVLGVGSLVGRRCYSEEICWTAVERVKHTGIAEEQELRQKGLFLDLRFIPLFPAGKAKRIIVVIEDITQLKQKDEELRVKAAVIKEIHHRVKNNLQTIASLLRLEQRRAGTEETKVALRDSINRISSIALVHEYLSGQGTELVDMEVLGNGVFRTVMSSMKTPELQLTMNFSAEDLRIPSQQAASMALVLNELLQNALEHGFENRRTGVLEAKIERVRENVAAGAETEKEVPAADDRNKKENSITLLLQVEDDGVGLPEGFDIQNTKSLGLKIVQTVVQSDLKGTFTIQAGADGKGTAAKALIRI